MPNPSRAQRFSALALKHLIQARPFDRAAWTRACSLNLHLRIGNGPVHMRREAALDALQDFLGPIDRFGGGFCEIWQRREAIYAETELVFSDAATPVPNIPCVLVARTTHGLLRDIRIHLDLTGFPTLGV